MKRIFYSLTIGASLLSSYSLAFSQSTDLQSATQQLIDASATIKSGHKLTQEKLNAIYEAAKIRQELLLKELSNTDDAVKYILSKQVINVLPLETKKYLEQEIDDLQGTLEVRAADYDDKEVLQYLLIVGKEIFYLHFTDGVPKHFETDAKVTIHHAMQIDTGDESNIHQLVLSRKDIDVVNPKYALPLSLGPQRTLTFLVNFTDKPNDRPRTQAQINELMYTTINNHFKESSYQQTSLVGKTVGWYVLNVNSNTACQTLTNQVSTLGDQEATKNGVDLSQYDRKVYIFPKTSACDWAGLGVVGGAKTSSWINGAFSDMRTPAHELGHNFGIYHSRLLKCSDSPNTGNCTRSTYGDGTDIMGAARTSHFNAYQKDMLGWLNYQASPPITTVSQSGTYTIDAFETNNKNPKALRILKRAGGSDYYYLEFRQGIGFDAELAACGTSCNYTRGVVFHQGNINIRETRESSDLLDMSPGGSSGLVALMPGQSWADPAGPNGGVNFEVVSAQSTGAVVKVTFGSNPPPPPPETKLEKDVPLTNLSGALNSETFYYVDVPASQTSLTIKMSDGSGDADLYVRSGQKPTTTVFDCAPYRKDNNETCTFNNPVAGRYYIMVKGYTAYNGVTLVATY